MKFTGNYASKVLSAKTIRTTGLEAGFTLSLVLSPLANFTENWLNKNFEFGPIWANFCQFCLDSCRNRVTVTNLAKLILMLAGTQVLVIKVKNSPGPGALANELIYVPYCADFYNACIDRSRLTVY